MFNLLIFGGTTEGRLLAEFCVRHQICAWISVTSSYGKTLLPKSPYLKVNACAMGEEQIAAFLRKNEIKLVIDGTHPYALQATEQIRRACEMAEIPYHRCLREEGTVSEEDVIRVSSAQEAVAFLEQTEGNILLTTGSKELSCFCAHSDLKTRIYARVLPSAKMVERCEALELSGSHLFCMQGPFSEEMNTALIHHVKAAYLVTKEAGTAGGFEEKVSAARECGCKVVLISRREEQDGKSLHQVYLDLLDYAGQEAAGSGSSVNKKVFSGLRVTLAGIGPGAERLMTGEVINAIRESDVLLGAPRVLEAAKAVAGEKYPEMISEYLPERVEAWMKERLSRDKGRTEQVVILFSGDTGFYSGTKKIEELLSRLGITFHVLPGVSSVSYMAAKLGVSWEGVALCTAHGREFDAASALRSGMRKIFLLLGGENAAGKLCESLYQNGLGDVRAAVGENLSYEEERLVAGTAESLRTEQFGTLCLMFLENEGER